MLEIPLEKEQKLKVENGEVGWVNLVVEEEISLKTELPPLFAKI